MARDDDPDLVRKLENWARWKLGDECFGGLSPYPIYNLGPRPPRADPGMPMLNGEALDMDEVIKELPERYKLVVETEYCKPWLAQSKRAWRCGCCVNTYKTRLIEAKLRIKSGLYRLHEKYACKLTVVGV